MLTELDSVESEADGASSPRITRWYGVPCEALLTTVVSAAKVNKGLE